MADIFAKVENRTTPKNLAKVDIYGEQMSALGEADD